MKIKERCFKQKQLTDRPQLSSRNLDENSFTMRLQKQYLANQLNYRQYHKKQDNISNKNKQKQNYCNMINSVPASTFINHNGFKVVGNYQNNKFGTQYGYQPMMTKSRYMGQRDEIDHQNQNRVIYKSSQNILKQVTQNDRPLTFGLVNKTEQIKNQMEYRQDIKMKNYARNQHHGGRRSQENMLMEKEFSVSGGIGVAGSDVFRCVNHHNKKAKYRLVSGSGDGKQEQDMIYCSKCAINLLQQGFKVQQMSTTRKTSNGSYQTSRYMVGSIGVTSRLQQMRNFIQMLNQIESRINTLIGDSSIKNKQVEQIQREIIQTEYLYDQMIGRLQQMKKQQIAELGDRKQKRVVSWQIYQKQASQELESIRSMKRQMSQFRNRFITMKQIQFKFLIDSFLNKIQGYGMKYQENQGVPNKMDDKTTRIIIQLCDFCKKMKDEDGSHVGQEVIKNKENNKKMRRQNWTEPVQDDFICKQKKGPFRTLFSEEESNQFSEKKRYYESNEHSPSFNKSQINPILEPIKKSKIVFRN